MEAGSEKIILNCEFNFKYLCPKIWDGLIPTEIDNVRHCTQCERNVFFCRTNEEIRNHAAAGECVAFKIEAASHIGEVDLTNYEVKP